MIRKLYFAIFMVCLVASQALFAQSAEELDNRNGFKDIKMVSDVTQYEGLRYDRDIEDEKFQNFSVYTAKKEHYESIGTVKVHELEVLAFKGEVYKIKVVTDKNTKLYGGLKKAFGEPNYSPRSDNYYWATDNLVLIFKSHSKNKLQLTYQSYIVEQKLKQEKKDEIQSISEDF